MLAEQRESKLRREFLDRIVVATRERIARLKTESSFDEMMAEAKRHQRRTFESALRQSCPAIVAEVKQASPSKGRFRGEFNHLALASAYETGGAAALSVVTEPKFFQGSDEWIIGIREVTTIPILRKDFILDPLQVAESAMLGADAILLIARLLSDSQMRELSEASGAAALDVLFEAHDEDDVAKIAGCDARIVGINARNLDTFAVDTETFSRLRPLLPRDCLAVAESGIETSARVRELARLGYYAFLIGETLVRSDDPSAVIRTLRSESGN